MTTLYAVGRFPKKGTWGVLAAPTKLEAPIEPARDDARRKQAIARLCVFLDEARRTLPFIADSAEALALIDVLSTCHPERLAQFHSLVAIREDLAALANAWEADDEPLIEWLHARTRGSLSITRQPLPNPWMKTRIRALWDALTARGVDVLDSRCTPRMLPLTCVLTAILGTHSAIGHHAHHHAQEAP